MCVKEKAKEENPREKFHSIALSLSPLMLVRLLFLLCVCLCTRERGMDVLHFTLNHWVVFYVVFSHFYSHPILRLMPHQWKRGSLFQTYKNNGHSTVANIHYGSHCVSLLPSFSSKSFFLSFSLFRFLSLLSFFLLLKHCLTYSHLSLNVSFLAFAL